MRLLRIAAKQVIASAGSAAAKRLTFSAIVVAATLSSATASAQAFDGGMHSPPSNDLRRQLVTQATQSCRQALGDAWPQLRCEARSVRWFPTFGLAAVVLCFDNPDLAKCSQRTDSDPKWRHSNAVAILQVVDAKVAHRDFVANEPSDEIIASELGVAQTSVGRVLVVPLRESGTGNGNLSKWYQLDADHKLPLIFDGSSTEIHAELQRQLPEGAYLWKGVWPRPAILGQDDVRTYRDGDGNCCPTNGFMSYRLALRDSALRVASVRYRVR